MFVITYSKILKNVQIRSVAVDKYFRKQSSTESLKQSSSDSKKKDLTIANQMQNGVNSNSREREKRIILKMNFQGRVIVPLFLMFLEVTWKKLSQF